jgi:hypothetical protein
MNQRHCPTHAGCCVRRSWQADKQTFRYIRNNTYAPNVPPPKPPKLLTAGTPAAKAAEAAILAAAAAGSKDGCGQFVPPTWPNAPLWNAQHVIQTKQEAEDSEHGPHKLLARLNGGYLPYTLLTKKVGAKATKVSCWPRGIAKRNGSAGEWVSCWVGQAVTMGCAPKWCVCWHSHGLCMPPSVRALKSYPAH